MQPKCDHEWNNYCGKKEKVEGKERYELVSLVQTHVAPHGFAGYLRKALSERELFIQNFSSKEEEIHQFSHLTSANVQSLMGSFGV